MADASMSQANVADAPMPAAVDASASTTNNSKGTPPAQIIFPSEATCGFTEAEFETALKVLNCLDERHEVYESRAIKPLRKVVFKFVTKAQATVFGGTTPADYRRKKAHTKLKRSIRDKVLLHDRQLIESRKLRQARLNQLNALKEANPNSNVPLIPDGAVDDGSGVNQSVGQAGGSSSVPLVITQNGETNSSEESKQMQNLLNNALEEVHQTRALMTSATGADASDTGDAAAVDSPADAATENNKLARGPGTDIGDERTQQQQLNRDTHKLLRPRSCYTCKGRFWELHHFYDQLCPSCAALNWRKRLQTCDLSGRVALLTGGRVKIGYQIGLKLLRCGASLVVTTRFPADAALRFSREQDYPKWRSRLSVFGIDLRDIAAVERMTQTLNQKLDRLDIIVNNACQTIRRPAAYYRHLLENEAKVAHEQDRRRASGSDAAAGADDDTCAVEDRAFNVIMPDGHHGLVSVSNEPRSIVAAALDSNSSKPVADAPGAGHAKDAAVASASANESETKTIRHMPSALISQMQLTEEDADDNPDLFPVDS
jgi:hypothetical protein